jgi:hypothetical protein
VAVDKYAIIRKKFRQTIIQRSESWVSVWLTTVIYSMRMKSIVGCENPDHNAWKNMDFKHWASHKIL